MSRSNLQSAIAHHRDGRWAEAESAYRMALAANPQDADALHMLGVLKLQLGQPDAGADLIRESLRNRPHQALAHANLGSALLQLRNPAAAVQQLDRALQIDPRAAGARLNRAHALRELRDARRALADVEVVLRTQPDNAEAWRLQGALLRGEGDLAGAAAAYAAAVRAEPTAAINYFELANLAFQQRQLQSALASYDATLRLAPRMAEAWNNRGAVLLVLGRAADALASCRQALALDAAHRGALVNCGNALRQLRRLDEAIDCYDHALESMPGMVPALVNRAAALLDTFRPAEALEDAESALASGPHAEAFNVRGAALLALRRPQQALAACEQALAINPELMLAHSNRAAALLELERPADALVASESALALSPGDARALANNAAALLRLEQHELALERIDAAVRTDPGHTPALLVRANVLGAMHRVDEAVASNETALQQVPQDARAWANLGTLLLTRGDAEPALRSFDTALRLGERTPPVLNNRSTALAMLQRYAEAATCLQELLDLDPVYPYAAGARLNARLQLCDWEGYDGEVARVMAGISRGDRADGPFSVLALPSTPALQRRCVETYARHTIPAQTPLWRGERYSHERIRIAYLSADLQVHATAYLMAGLFEKHDRRRFETIAVSYGPDADDSMRARLRGSFDQFLEVRQMNDREIAGLLRSLEIDIAVDLKGYTRDSRPRILSYRPAPVQVSYLGFPGTMAVDFMDYVLADRTVIPADDVVHFSENVVYLPHCYQVTDDTRPIAGIALSRAEAGLPADGFVFCCHNNCYKVSPPVFDTWMQLLRAVEGSVLWLLCSESAVIANLRREASARGVDPARLVFANKLPQAEHLARYRLADLFLDTLPYNAHTTASDALWAGLPVLTCTGSTFAGKVGASILHAAGLPELVTHELEEYRDVALALAREPARLHALRERLAQLRASCPLFDTDAFRRALEAAYVEMWSRAQRGEPPSPIHLPAPT